MGDNWTGSNDESEPSADRPLIVGERIGGPPTNAIQRLEWEGHRFPGRIPDRLWKAWRGFMLLMFLVPLLVFLGTVLPVSLPSMLCQIGMGERCPPDTGPLLSESELREAEARLEQIYQQGDMEACTEFKGKRYAEKMQSGTATTELYFTCVHNLSLSLKDEGRCLSLSDEYSKRICLQALAIVYQDPSYCQRADAFAQDEMARELYPQTASAMCFQNLNACEYIEDITIREHCLLQRSLQAGDLDASLCRSLAAPQARDVCFETAAVFRNVPELCLETTDADNCYWSASVITAPNLGMADEIDLEKWCEKINDSMLRSDCYRDVRR